MTYREVQMWEILNVLRPGVSSDEAGSIEAASRGDHQVARGRHG